MKKETLKELALKSLEITLFYLFSLLTSSDLVSNCFAFGIIIFFKENVEENKKRKIGKELTVFILEIILLPYSSKLLGKCILKYIIPLILQITLFTSKKMKKHLEKKREYAIINNKKKE